ncbi:hypothetical protein C5L22_21475 [Pantoea ananatis]|nr:hypothetical protein C5L22_21475 [Pantoea ananatis]
MGLTTRQRREAGGGHQAVNAVDLQGQEIGEAAAAWQQNRQQQEAEREYDETASRREKAHVKREYPPWRHSRHSRYYPTLTFAASADGANPAPLARSR